MNDKIVMMVERATYMAIIKDGGYQAIQANNISLIIDDFIKFYDSCDDLNKYSFNKIIELVNDFYQTTT